MPGNFLGVAQVCGEVVAYVRVSYEVFLLVYPKQAVYYIYNFIDRWSCHWLPGKMQINTGLDPDTTQAVEVLQHLT